MRTGLALIFCLGISACSGGSSEESSVGTGGPVELVGPTGETFGRITMTEDANGVTLAVTVSSGLGEGFHGVHLHEVGRCEGPDFKTAGGHWNPTGKQHGRDNTAGAHIGDLSNLAIDGGGSGTANYLVSGVLSEGSEWQFADEDGTALIIHANPDDYRSDPSGDSGGRVACAIIVPPR